MTDSELLRFMFKNPEVSAVVMLGHARRWSARRLIRELKKTRSYKEQRRLFA